MSFSATSTLYGMKEEARDDRVITVCVIDNPAEDYDALVHEDELTTLDQPVHDTPVSVKSRSRDPCDPNRSGEGRDSLPRGPPDKD